MAGSFELDSNNAPLAGPALPVAVYAYDPDAGYSLLPNIVPLRIDRREGCVPSAARFEYQCDDALALNLGWPSQFEEIFGLYTAPNPYVVTPDQRLVVMAQNPDGSPWVLWDGFAQVPQVEVDAEGETAVQHVTFTGAGVEARCWDTPIAGSVHRDSDTVGIQDTSGNSDVLVYLPPRFNPSDQGPGASGGSLPNRSPSQTTDPNTNLSYYVFVDPKIEREPDPRRLWAVPDSVCYVLATENGDEQFVQNPDFDLLATLLVGYAPVQGAAVMGPGNAVVVVTQVPDYNCENHAWPDAVSALVAYCGFLATFDTYTDGDGLPQTALRFYRRDAFAGGSPKSVYLQPSQIGQGGATLDPTSNNARSLDLSMDMNGVVNAYAVETDQQIFEISIILAPLYKPAAGDAAAATRPKFRRANLVGQPSAVQRAYRWYGVDEDGDGHWTVGDGGGSWSTLPADFDWLFPPDQNGNSTWTVRKRPGSRTLLALDDDGNPLRADLSISFDYTAASRDQWDGSGTWQSIQGGWRLLPDQLGIEVTADDVENWGAGDGKKIGGAAPAVAGLDIRGITWWANPPSGTPTSGNIPSLRLTTVIRGDLRIDTQALQRIASPTQYSRARIADRRDMYGYAAIDPSSMNWANEINQPNVQTNSLSQVLMRDDTLAAKGLAEQLRGAHEFPSISGRITIPWITDYYAIGDRIDMVAGRGASLCTNIAVSAGEAPNYPWVVGVSWNFDGKQETTLTLSDHHALPGLGPRLRPLPRRR